MRLLSSQNSMHRAFTLVELLVVIGIIALLIGILFPVLAKAKANANRVTCQAHLRDIGSSFTMYLTDSKSHLPAVNIMPSLNPPLSDAPSLPKLLQPYVKTAVGVFHCPSDSITKSTANAPAGYLTYFDREGSSYQYNPLLALYAGQRVQDTLNFAMGHPELLTIIDEYEAFHGKPGVPGSMYHLFGDLHVGTVGQ